jgi:hypothetical protein
MASNVDYISLARDITNGILTDKLLALFPALEGLNPRGRANSIKQRFFDAGLLLTIPPPFGGVTLCCSRDFTYFALATCFGVGFLGKGFFFLAATPGEVGLAIDAGDVKP